MPAPDTTLPQIRSAFITTILGIKKTNGYTIDLPDDHVYKISDQTKILSKDAEDYPKLIFTLDSGDNSKGASRKFFSNCRYGVTVILREQYVPEGESPPMGWMSVADQVELLVGDLEKAVLRNNSLGGIVDSILPANFETDANSAYPEGIAVYWFDIAYNRVI